MSGYLSAECPWNWTAFGALGQWFAGIVTLGTVGYIIFRDYFRGPLLILTCDPKKDVKDQKNTAEEINRWIRIRVKNQDGRKTAKNCRAFLVGITKTDEATPIDKFPNDARGLGWTHANPNESLSRDILPGITHWADLACGLQGEKKLHILTSPHWVIDSPGKYAITVQVSADDTKSKLITIQIQWDGTWDSIRVV